MCVEASNFDREKGEVMHRLYILVRNQPTGIGWICLGPHGPRNPWFYHEVDEDFSWESELKKKDAKRARHNKSKRVGPDKQPFLNPRKLYINRNGSWESVGYFEANPLADYDRVCISSEFKEKRREENRKVLEEMGVSDFRGVDFD